MGSDCAREPDQAPPPRLDLLHWGPVAVGRSAFRPGQFIRSRHLRTLSEHLREGSATEPASEGRPLRLCRFSDEVFHCGSGISAKLGPAYLPRRSKTSTRHMSYHWAAIRLRQCIRGDQEMTLATKTANGQTESCATTTCELWFPHIEQNYPKIMGHRVIAAFIERYKHNWISKRQGYITPARPCENFGGRAA